jgi:DNA polymerase III delta prime subunit
MIEAINNLYVEKYRPKTLEEIVLSKDDRKFFESLAKKKEIPHLLFAGTQGSGKTSLALILIKDVLECEYLYINASDENSIDVIRTKVIGFAKTKSFDGKIKIVLLDEADAISVEGMRCLRNVIEEFSATCRFILTCNYLHKIILPLQSRTQHINLIPPIEGVIQRVSEILKKENITVPPDQKPLLIEHIRKNLPDVRRIINDVEQFSVNGILNIKSESSSGFASSLLKRILAKEDAIKMRKDIIENERLFSADYRSLLKSLFECVYESELDSHRKMDLLSIISDGMEKDAFVVDKEINCFSTIISLSRNIF